MEKEVSWRRTGDASWKRGGGEVIEISKDDMLEEIMVRLSVKSLVRFQIVSKHWRDDEDGVYLSTRDDSEEKKVVISNSLDGLLCLYGFTDLTKPIKVINPATRWSQTLPLAKIQQLSDKNKYLEFPSPGFGKDYVTGAYKLVWLHNIYNDDDTTTSSCEVFDFGVKQWRQISPPRPDHRIRQDREPFFANGWLYWLCQDKTKLVAFDLHMDMFRVVPNPSSPSSVEMHLGSIDDDRRLMWISEINKDGMQHVWRLTNHNTGGALLKMGKMLSFELNKIFWIEPSPHPSSHLRLEAVSKKGNKAMLAIPSSHCLLLFQHPNLLTSISYSSPRPSSSVFRPYFPSFASPL